MIKITSSRSFKTLRSGDPDWHFSPDGLRIVPRAGFEINEKCPREYQMIITECIDRGWIKPVAYMRDTEYTLELLKK
jgi:hypothetical protein